MQNSFDKLAEILFQKHSLSACNENELERLTMTYPFFAPGHLMYNRYLKEKNDPRAADQSQKTVLYFNNPNWFSLLINQQREDPKHDDNEKINFPEPEESHNDELVIDNKEKPFATGTKARPELKPETVTPSQDLIFEPYYTVDYFASQGIRQQDEIKASDTLGLKLRSFTDWLKTIRKMTPGEIAALADSGSEEKVVRLAGDSLENNDVETESMAEVWIKQGEPGKAINIYNKLSLKNPSKRSYFAGLIEKLKTD